MNIFSLLALAVRGEPTLLDILRGLPDEELARVAHFALNAAASATVQGCQGDTESAADMPSAAAAKHVAMAADEGGAS